MDNQMTGMEAPRRVIHSPSAAANSGIYDIYITVNTGKKVAQTEPDDSLAGASIVNLTSMNPYTTSIGIKSAQISDDGSIILTLIKEAEYPVSYTVKVKK